MTSTANAAPISDRELVLTRIIDAPREKLFRAWTDPELLKQWFAPLPWTISAAELDLRPGGTALVVMRDPDGNEYPNRGIYLEVVENERLVFTDALLPGYRPAEKPFFTATLQLFEQGKGTRYVATALHRDPDGRKQHEDMGFHDGWGTVVDQMVAYIKSSM